MYHYRGCTLSVYADKCLGWVGAGECERTPEFMLVHCQKSCDSCGVVKAFVQSDSTLMCQSPPLGNIADFSFEVTRNGKTWTQGNISVSTYDCQGQEEDDEPLEELEASIAVIQSSAITFDPAKDNSVELTFTVENDGEIAIGGFFSFFLRLTTIFFFSCMRVCISIRPCVVATELRDEWLHTRAYYSIILLLQVRSR